jgi:ribosome biogenesis GTPase / thiamine phosphate phosphatase
VTTAGLLPLGWTTALAEAAEGRAGQPVRVVEPQRSGFRVDDGEQVHLAQLHPTLLRQLRDEGESLVVGDWALWDADGGWLTALLPRRSLLSRHRDDGRLQRLAAHIDRVVMVMGLDGDFSEDGLLPYRQMAEAAGVPVMAVLTKPDRAPDLQAQTAAVVRSLGPSVPVFCLDPRQAQAAEALAPWLQPGQTLALFGSSGVGKSSLTNTLVGGAVQRTGATQAQADLGRHTTTARCLHRLPGGACIVDTPGLRATHRMPASAPEDRYDDVTTLAADCRFSDCQHEAEPGCAVRERVAADRLAAWRARIQTAADGRLPRRRPGPKRSRSR